MKVVTVSVAATGWQRVSEWVEMGHPGAIPRYLYVRRCFLSRNLYSIYISCFSKDLNYNTDENKDHSPCAKWLTF